MTTTQDTWLEELQRLVTNPLDVAALQGKRIAAILGDTPSTYAKSPRLWNAAFAALGLEAVYVPFDVPQDQLSQVIQLLRCSDAFLGGSVTVPYKVAVIPLLDELDPLAERIGAVNVIAREADGRLVGYNTDGLGGLRALTSPAAGGSQPLFPDLSRARVLLLGAGGAAQALAFSLWDQMLQGELIIANRTQPQAQHLVERLAGTRSGRLTAIDEGMIVHHLPHVDLVINATVKGQGGIRTLRDGRWTCLEPYSALGPAHPEVLAGTPGAEEAFREDWYRKSVGDIQRNQEVSLVSCSRLPRPTVCYDIIYSPLETVFLRHARWSGHPTLNGRMMNLAQAAEAFTRFVCRPWLRQVGPDHPTTHERVLCAMATEWDR